MLKPLKEMKRGCKKMKKLHVHWLEVLYS
jgi:hypothetical protein